jgi:type IV secretion system protein VirB6
MAAAFFQGTLGQFMSYSAFGSVGARGSEGYSQALASGRGGPAPAPITQTTPIQSFSNRPSAPIQIDDSFSANSTAKRLTVPGEDAR